MERETQLTIRDVLAFREAICDSDHHFVKPKLFFQFMINYKSGNNNTRYANMA
jgi:hypothetical protein